MPSLFDPAALALGFWKIFGIIFASATITLIYIFYPPSPPHLSSALFHDASNWWNTSTILVKAIGIIGASLLYLGIVFYATLTIYDYLLAKQAPESTPKN